MSTDWIDALQELRNQAASCVLVTVCGVSGSAPGAPGARMIVSAGERVFGTIGGGSVEQDAINQATGLLAGGGVLVTRETLSNHDQCCGGMVELMFEVLFRGPRLHLFGGGHVGIEVLSILAGTRFRLDLVEQREEWPPMDRLAAGVTLHRCSPVEYLDSLHMVQECEHALVMTPSHELDYTIVRRALQLPFAWVGLIGSRSKAIQFRRRLLADGVTEQRVATLACPIGERAVGRSPREVALAIAHELLASEGRAARLKP